MLYDFATVEIAGMLSISPRAPVNCGEVRPLRLGRILKLECNGRSWGWAIGGILFEVPLEPALSVSFSTWEIIQDDSIAEVSCSAAFAPSLLAA